MAAHRYWRLVVTASNETPPPANYSCIINELEFRGTVGGADATVPETSGSLITASHGSAGSNTPQKAFDDVLDAYSWIPNTTSYPVWIKYDCNGLSPIDVAEISIRVADNSGEINQAPLDFYLQYSDDDVSWTSILIVNGSSSWSLSEVRTFETGNVIVPQADILHLAVTNGIVYKPILADAANLYLLPTAPELTINRTIVPTADSIHLTGLVPTVYNIPIMTTVSQFSDSVSPIYELLNIITESFISNDTVSPTYYESLIDALESAAIHNDLANTILQIIDSMSLVDIQTNVKIETAVLTVLTQYSETISPVFLQNLIDVYELDHTLSSQLATLIALSDSYQLSDTTDAVSIAVVLNELFQLSDSMNLSQILLEILTSSALYNAEIVIDGDVYTLVLNPETLGISTFTNYKFNSISYPYAANNTGIYKLDDAATDDGVNFEAVVKTGIFDFGTIQKKNIPYAYIGMTKSGRVLLKTVTNAISGKTEVWYEVSYDSEVDETVRIQLGKGVKAKYWQFELTTIEGGDFELDTVEFLPVVLKRRVR